jgi:2TM domain
MTQSFSDNDLRQMAHKHVDFRRHLAVYIIVNGVLWLIWYFTGQGYPWPLWPACGWGIGLIFHYVFDYQSLRMFSEDEEFEKLKKRAEGH